jgi:hypothetical protein
MFQVENFVGGTVMWAFEKYEEIRAYKERVGPVLLSCNLQKDNERQEAVSKQIMAKSEIKRALWELKNSFLLGQPSSAFCCSSILASSFIMDLK